MSLFDIHVLIGDPWGRIAIRDALRAASQGDYKPEVHFAADWPEIVAHSGEAGAVFVLDPNVGEDSARDLGLLVEAGCAERVVLYLTGSTSAEDYQRYAGHPRFLLLAADAPDRPNILEALAIVGTRALIASAVGHLDDSRGERLVRNLLTIGYTRWTVGEAAAAMHLSERTLRRRCSDVGLPPPGRLIEWGRLIRAVVLHELGLRSGFGVAVGIGYTDETSLYRLSRRITEFTWGELLAHDPVDILAVELDRWTSG